MQERSGACDCWMGGARPRMFAGHGMDSAALTTSAVPLRRNGGPSEASLAEAGRELAPALHTRNGEGQGAHP